MSLTENMECTESLMEALETQGGFSPLEYRKRMEPGEGLTKIWMCPSSEMTSALFSTKPANALGHHGYPEKESLNILEKYFDEKKGSKGSQEGSLGSEAGPDYYDDDDDSDSSGSKGGGSAPEEPCYSSDEAFPDERIDSLKRSLKQTYDEKLAAGTDMLANYSLQMLDNQLFSLVTMIRLREKNRVNRELKPIVGFIDKYLVEVNRENGSLLKKKYKLRRQNCIARLVDAAEESFAHKCTQIEKELSDKYHFRVQKLRNKYHTDYKQNLRGEIRKLVKRFKDEKSKILEEHDNNVKSIKEKYNKLYEGMKEFECGLVQEELDALKKCITDIEEAQKKEPKDQFGKCSDDSAWLCILNQLLTDLQLFLKKYISSEADVKQLLNRIKQSRPEFQKKKTSRAPLNVEPGSNETVIQEHSADSVPCIKERNELQHRALLSDAAAILEKVLSDVANQKVKREDFWKRFFYENVDSLPNIASFYKSDEDCSRYNFPMGDSSGKSSSSSLKIV